jgi:hypothetical protein
MLVERHSASSNPEKDSGPEALLSRRARRLAHEPPASHETPQSPPSYYVPQYRQFHSQNNNWPMGERNPCMRSCKGNLLERFISRTCLLEGKRERERGGDEEREEKRLATAPAFIPSYAALILHQTSFKATYCGQPFANGIPMMQMMVGGCNQSYLEAPSQPI